MAAKKTGKSDKEQSEDKKPSPQKKSGGKASSQTKKGKSMGFIKKLYYVLMALLIVILSICIYVVVNIDSFKAKIAERITLKLDKITLDADNLTDKQTKLKLHIAANNSLPIDVVFKELNFDMNLGDYEVAKGMKAEVSTPLNSNSERKLIISVNVDSIQARRAISKGIEKNAGKLLKTVLSKKSVTKEIGEDIKALAVINGSADLMVKGGAFEIPFNKKVKF